MTSLSDGPSVLDYKHCIYDGTRVTMRGPAKPLDARFVAFVGGTETYGRFIADPFPDLLEQRLGLTCVNFGAINAGLDLYLKEPGLLQMIAKAELCVVQVTGAHRMSNRFFMVHPRRNDRFLSASEKLTKLYPEVDFTDFTFTGHMLQALADKSTERFRVVKNEMREAWTSRMRHFLGFFTCPVVLLWFADHALPEDTDLPLRENEQFVTRGMVRCLAPHLSATVEVVESEAARAQGTAGMVFSDFDAPVVAELMGPAAHQEVAHALEPVCRALLPAAQET